MIARNAIERPLYTWILILACLFGGAAGYLAVGKLEDPVFTLKPALVVTAYPGATAAEVAIEVSEVLESEIQKMDEVDFITSNNTPGLSVIEVEMKPRYDGSELPQIWDDLRDRVADAIPNLPSGARPPQVNDGFGDVYGLYYAVTALGFSDSEIWEIASFLRREVLAVRGVADAELLGLPEEAIFVEPSGRLDFGVSVTRSCKDASDRVLSLNLGVDLTQHGFRLLRVSQLATYRCWRGFSAFA